MRNFKSLTEEEKKMVPETLFENAKSYLTIRGESSKRSSEKHMTDSEHEQEG